MANSCWSADIEIPDLERQTKLDVTPLDRNGTINLLPHAIFYVGGIVAGSKALASLPVPVFVSACNLAPASIFLLDNLPQPLCRLSAVSLVPAALALLSSASVLLLCDAESSDDPTGGDTPYFWMLVHVVLITAQSLHDRVVDPRFSPMDLLYYANLFGVVILAPASLYLEEAFQALEFRHRRQIHFYIGCILSGVLGLLLRMRTAAASSASAASCESLPSHFNGAKGKSCDEDCRRYRPSRGAISGLVASTVALVIFPGGFPKTGVLVAATGSLIAALFIPYSDHSRDSMNSQGGSEHQREVEDGVYRLVKAQQVELRVV